MKPTIISVSRREDIPAQKAEWFMEKLRDRRVDVCSPFGAPRVVDLSEVKFAIFWTKNPEPFFPYLKGLPFEYYFQFTLNDYPEYEHNLPHLTKRIEIFIELSKRIGKNRVIWRYDPFIINEKVNIEELLNRVQRIGEEIYMHTNKLIFSFVDPYKKLRDKFYEIDDYSKHLLAENLKVMNMEWNLSLETCSEKFNHTGIGKAHCIDPDLIRNIQGSQKWIPKTKDKNQREACGCVTSVDIGSYRQCTHGCDYCFAK